MQIGRIVTNSPKVEPLLIFSISLAKPVQIFHFAVIRIGTRRLMRVCAPGVSVVDPEYFSDLDPSFQLVSDPK
jgi:hypothetical protein